MPSLFCDAQKNLLRFADALLLCAAFLLAAWLVPAVRLALDRSGLLQAHYLQNLSPNPHFDGLGDWQPLLWVLVVVLAATLCAMELLGGYKEFVRHSRVRLLVESALAVGCGLAVLSLAFYVVKFPGYSRLFLFTFVSLSVVSLTSYRLLLQRLVEQRFREGVYSRETVLIGSGEALGRLTRFFAANVSSRERRLIGYFDVPGAAEAGGEAEMASVSDRLPRIGSVDEIGEVLIHRPIQDVVVVMPAAPAPWLPRVLEACDYFRISVHLVPHALLATDLVDLHLPAGPLGKLPAVTLMPDEENGQAGVYLWKRLTDVVVSAVALAVLSPVIAAIALAIKLTTPKLRIFYPWKVVGFRGRRFTGYKFTTMVADADERKADLAAQNEMSGPVFKISNDPRVTPLGRFLRKYSLNELPQFWSVLVGDMSLVGPRPAGPHELSRYELWHKRKLSVRPGITCFWQVRGRNKISNFDDWVRMDLEYIQKRSLWLDWQILLRTAWVVVRGSGS